MRIFSMVEALDYQKQTVGKIVFTRDTLYSLARRKKIPVIKIGKRKILFSSTTIDKLLNGEFDLGEN